MKTMTSRLFQAGLVVPAALLASTASAGPLVISGDAADSHASPAVYGHLLGLLQDNIDNGQTGILAIGVDVPSDAATWIMNVSAQLPDPQPVAFINDATISVFGLSGYSILFVPSPSELTDGGISPAESELLNARVVDIAAFLTSGGGVLGLTQAGLENPYAYLGGFVSVSSLDTEPFTNVSPTEIGDFFGISLTNLDGCCWHNVFSAFPEDLVGLATADEPKSQFDGTAALLTGFVELPDINLNPPEVFEAAGEPSIEAVGDLDGNNTPDVVIVVPDIDSIQVFLNNGSTPNNDWQGLTPLGPIGVGANPSSVTVGLFNADAHLDVAVANKDDDDVSILLNTGNQDGSFTAAPNVALPGMAPTAIVAQDFDNDGLTDLAVTLELDNVVVILLGDGTGGFSVDGGGGAERALPILLVGNNPLALSTGDLDDNKDDGDLAGGNRGSGLQGTAGEVFVLRSLGGGNYMPADFYPVGTDPVDVSLADLNGDGSLDIAAANNGDSTVSFLLNNGNGTFAPSFELTVGLNPTSVRLVDLNNDQKPDVAVVAKNASGQARLKTFKNLYEPALLGGSIPFSIAKSFNVGGDPNYVVDSDMNQDGLPDLVVVHETPETASGGATTVLLNNPAPIACPGDLDGDGFINVADLLVLIGSLGPCVDCPADLNGDNVVDVMDLLAMLGVWGPCPSEAPCPFDLNGDGDVNGLDIVELILNAGPCEDPDFCPWDLDGDGVVGLSDLILLLLNLGPCPS